MGGSPQHAGEPALWGPRGGKKPVGVGVLRVQGGSAQFMQVQCRLAPPELCKELRGWPASAPARMWTGRGTAWLKITFRVIQRARGGAAVCVFSGHRVL